MLFRFDCFTNSFFVFLLFLFCLHIFLFLSFKNMGWKIILILIKLFCISEILYIFKWRVGTVQTFSKTGKGFVKMFRMGRTKKIYNISEIHFSYFQINLPTFCTQNLKVFYTFIGIIRRKTTSDYLHNIFR